MKKNPPRDAVAPASLLIVDEHASVRESMLITFRHEGYDVQEAESGERAIEMIERLPFDLVITDLLTSAVDGMQVLKRAKEISPHTEVVVVTPCGTFEGAVEAIQWGAYDFLAKPFQTEELTWIARRALERKGLAQKVRALEEAARGREPLHGIVAVSPAMKNVLHMVEQVARQESAVLITGESGTGKELVARALHALSPRNDKRLVVVNCGAIPENLQESELFGHIKGSFTGAYYSKPGLFEEAHGGTAFLGEIDEMSLPVQFKLLCFLQDGEARRAGTTVSRRLNVRIVAATNRDLKQSVEEKAFREDLFYRVNVIPIHIPPLRERSDDIPPLVRHFVRREAARLGMRHPPSVSPRVMSLLTSRPWPGNVRELENAVERAMALDRDGMIGIDDLPYGVAPRREDEVIDRALGRSLTLRQLEREYILEVLAASNGSRVKTAERLGITTATLWRKLKRYESGGL